MRRTRRGFPGFMRASALAGVLAAAWGSAPSPAQEAGAGLVQRLQALEAELSALGRKVATLEERRFESGDILMYSVLSRAAKQAIGDADEKGEKVAGHLNDLKDTNQCAPANESPSRGLLSRKVVFSKPFARTPKVVVGIRGMETGHGGSQVSRLYLDVLKVDSSGFEYSFYTWCDTPVYAASGTWFAFLEDEAPQAE